MRKPTLLASLFTLAVIGVLVKLGFWQLDRANEKQQLLDDFNQQQVAPASLNYVTTTELQRFETVTVSGSFLPDQYFLLDNQIYQQQVGYQVLGLFAYTDAQQRQQVVPINMGWVTAGNDRQQLPKVALPREVLELEGLYYQPERNFFQGDDVWVSSTQWPLRIAQYQAAQLRDLTQLPLTDFVVLLSESSDLGWPRNWQPQVMPPEKHRAYALQWFTLALAAALVFWFARRSIIKKTKE